MVHNNSTMALVHNIMMEVEDEEDTEDLEDVVVHPELDIITTLPIPSHPHQKQQINPNPATRQYKHHNPSMPPRLRLQLLLSRLTSLTDLCRLLYASLVYDALMHYVAGHTHLLRLLPSLVSCYLLKHVRVEDGVKTRIVL
jgi:hypothetical protein